MHAYICKNISQSEEHIIIKIVYKISFTLSRKSSKMMQHMKKQENVMHTREKTIETQQTLAEDMTLGMTRRLISKVVTKGLKDWPQAT